MPVELERITVFCFAASYAMALGVELLRLKLVRPALRWIAVACTGAGLIAHTAFVLVNPLPLQTAFGSLIFLAWILAVFCLYGALHHRRLAWELFVLPIVLGLVIVAQLFQPGTAGRSAESSWFLATFDGTQFWSVVHSTLIVLAAVGVCVGFVASVMYLVQVRRLKAKQLPSPALRLWSLERLEAMNRRAIILAFPLLTTGLLVAAAQMFGMPDARPRLENWKVVSTIGLWVVFAILLYVRYGIHAAGRQVAFLTIVAFGLMLAALIAAHPYSTGGAP